MGHFLKKDLRTHFNGFQLDVYFPRKESLCSCNSWKKALKEKNAAFSLVGNGEESIFVWFAQTDEGITDKEFCDWLEFLWKVWFTQKDLEFHATKPG